jgi:hypothetical protein
VRLLHAVLMGLAMAGGHAQPVIDSTSAPAAGSTYVYVVGDLLNLPGTGMGQVWDASMAGTLTTDTVTFIDTADASGAGAFPQAQVVRRGAGRETFLAAGPDGLYELGYHVPDPGLTAVYSDLRQVMSWPCELGTAWTDTFSGSYMFQGEAYIISGTASFTATGSGMLLLPGGTALDVLRIDGIETYDEVGGGNTYSRASLFTQFHTPNAKLPVARNVQSTAVFNGAASNPLLRFQYLDGVSLGQRVVGQDAQMLRCWPAPAAATISVDLPRPGDWDLRLFASHGQVVRHFRTIARDSGPYAMDLVGLPAGVYRLLASMTDGRIWWRTVVVEP